MATAGCRVELEPPTGGKVELEPPRGGKVELEPPRGGRVELEPPTEFSFPFPPYTIQKEFMLALFNTLNKGGLALAYIVFMYLGNIISVVDRPCVIDCNRS